MAFERAIYTDVTATEALDGNDGFNFQAASVGVTPADLDVIRNGLLHRVQAGWGVEHDPLAHPATCAYVVHGESRYLGRGISTGSTINGRPGNQLTEAVVTARAEDFVPYRPAQLYGAEEWTLQRSAGKMLDPWPTPLAVRPEFQVEGLAELVTADPWGAQVLPAFLTMIERAVAEPPTRLILVHRDLDTVMRWISLGSLFLDPVVAGDLQFRALVADPWRLEANVVGLSPEFDFRDSLHGANVLDLEARTLPELAPSETGRVHAAWLLEHGADETLDAIAVERRWEQSFGAERATAVVHDLLFPDPRSDGGAGWTAALAAVTGLVGQGQRDELDLYTDEVIDGVVGYRPRTDAEFERVAEAYRVAREAGLASLAAGLLEPTLSALASAPHQASGFAGKLAALDTPAAAGTTADADNFAAVVAGAPHRALPDLLATARSLGLPLPAETLSSALDAVVPAWLEEPGTGRAWERWQGATEAVARLGELMVAGLRARDVSLETAVLRGDWDHLERHLRSSPAGAWFSAAQSGRIALDRRVGAIELSFALPVEAWTLALAGARMPRDSRVYAAWIQAHGLDVQLGIGLHEQLVSGMHAVPGPGPEPSRGDWTPVLWAVQSLPWRGAPPVPALWALAEEFKPASRAIEAAIDGINDRTGRGLSQCRPFVRRWAPVAPERFGILIVKGRDRSEAGRIAEEAGDWGPDLVRGGLLQIAEQGQGLRAIEYALHVARDEHPVTVPAALDALDLILARYPRARREAEEEPRIRKPLAKALASRHDRPGKG